MLLFECLLLLFLHYYKGMVAVSKPCKQMFQFYNKNNSKFLAIKLARKIILLDIQNLEYITIS
jgi:hypothetical protein